MEIAIIIILLLSVVLFSLQLTFFVEKKVVLAYLLLLSAGIYFAYPYCIEQSYSSIQKDMNNVVLLSNFLVLLMAEALLGALLSILQIKMLFGGAKIHKGWSYAIYFSGVAIAVALFYAESLLFILIRSMDFQMLAILLALCIPLALWGLQLLLSALVPEREIRIELKFFLHIFQILLSMLLSVLVLKLPVNMPPHNYTLPAFLLIVAVALLVALLGYFIHHIKIKKTWK